MASGLTLGLPSALHGGGALVGLGSLSPGPGLPNRLPLNRAPHIPNWTSHIPECKMVVPPARPSTEGDIKGKPLPPRHVA
jgi:hypothetical protein